MQTESGMSFLSRVAAKPVISLATDLFLKPLNPPEIIEISGAAGAGKTLLCLDFMATALLPKSIFNIPLGGLSTSVIFIDCDHHFSILHFADLMDRKIKRECAKIKSEWKKLGNAKMHEEIMTMGRKIFKEKVNKTIKDCLENLLYFRCTNSNQFAVTLLSIEQWLISRPEVSLVFIDSISAFYWYDRIYRVDSWRKMESHLNNIFQNFLNTLHKNYLVCICTKQNLFKTTKENHENQSFAFNSETIKDDFKTYEFLGKEWTNGVSIRITMTVKDGRLLTSTEDQHCSVEINQDGESRSFYCTFHDDGIRWLNTESQQEKLDVCLK